MKRPILYLLTAAFLYSCGQTKLQSDNIEITIEENTPLPGFNIEDSDPQTIMIADKVMNAMGGRKAWDDTRIICWTFFDKRRLIWDKFTGNVRIDFLDSDQKILVNIHSLEGKVYKNGQEMTNPDSLASYLKKGKSTWINDSYWLVMPYKLKDTGVTLHFIGEDTTESGRDSQLFQMTFENVGDTPDNVYNVWVDFETNLVSQWAYFKSYEDVEPVFISSWEDYQQYGKILLSGDRGWAKLTNIKVLDQVPETVFSSLEEVNI